MKHSNANAIKAKKISTRIIEPNNKNMLNQTQIISTNSGVKHNSNMQRLQSDFNSTQTAHIISVTPRAHNHFPSASLFMDIQKDCFNLKNIVKDSLNNASKILYSCKTSANTRPFTSLKKKIISKICSSKIAEIPECEEDHKALDGLSIVNPRNCCPPLTEMKNYKMPPKKIKQITQKKHTYQLHINTTNITICNEKAEDTPNTSFICNSSYVGASTAHSSTHEIPNKTATLKMQIPPLNLKISPKKAPALPIYAQDSLLAIYKGWKTRSVMKMPSIVFITSEIEQFGKMIPCEKAFEHIEFTRRMKWLHNEFNIRLNKILNDKCWYNQRVSLRATFIGSNMPLLFDDDSKNSQHMQAHEVIQDDDFSSSIQAPLTSRGSSKKIECSLMSPRESIRKDASSCKTIKQSSNKPIAKYFKEADDVIGKYKSLLHQLKSHSVTQPNCTQYFDNSFIVRT